MFDTLTTVLGYAFLFFMALGFLLQILGGEEIDRDVPYAIDAQLAYRVLCAKLLQLNGRLDADTYEVHQKFTPDEPETSELRGSLRDAAATTPLGWQRSARDLAYRFKRFPDTLLDRFEHLIIQMNASPDGVTVSGQAALVELARLWGIGPNKTLEIFVEWRVQPLQPVLAWQDTARSKR
ncbi:hypothetical protein [Sphingosinicella sp. BN140058]|uniref:hypothetical protein n=1 Tax=Sphingosinicella sp. BN140058 TaxID=1892855 RepID=UPI001011817C|nr:hypothetical protein [Sphingosinicella sp. BN140058]QAY80250.1 hypothetical protein ETR14_26770 [Sphingosinicella sp. BN140058]